MTPQTPPPAPARGIARFIWPILCLFQFSLIGSWLLVAPHHHDSHGAEETATASKSESHEPAKQSATGLADGEQPDPRQGEILLRDGNYAQALPHFLPSQPDAKAALSDTLQFRAALCLEGLGRWSEALAAAREAAAKSCNERIVAASQVVQARIFVRMHNTAEAKALLYPLILKSGQPGRYDPSLIAEARYLAGMALSWEAFAEQRFAGIDEKPARANFAVMPIPHSLGWVANLAENKEHPRDLPADIDILQRHGPKGEDALVIGSINEIAVSALMEKLAALAKLRVIWSTEAAQRIEGRSVSIAVDGNPLVNLIEAILQPTGLHHAIKDGDLLVTSEKETPKDAFALARAASARRALREAVFADPGHPLAAAAYLELGNDEAASGNRDEAVSWYERLIAETGRSPYVASACFSLGLIHQARKDYPAARKSLYRVVDRTPGHELCPRALVQIGLTFLHEGQPSDAVFPLRQALTVSQGSPARADAVIALGAAHLLNGNAREANTVFTANKEHVNQDASRTPAAFLDALARFRVAALGKNGRVEAADLLTALLAFQHDRKLGTLGQLLIGQAYKELGMTQELAKVYEEAIKSASGPLADEMTFELAECHFAAGKRNEAIKLHSLVADRHKSKWSYSSRLRLAAVSLQDNKPEDCLKSCAAMLQEHGQFDQNAVLQLMGAAYEQLGDFQKAARCFSGQLPD